MSDISTESCAEMLNEIDALQSELAFAEQVQADFENADDTGSALYETVCHSVNEIKATLSEIQSAYGDECGGGGDVDPSGDIAGCDECGEYFPPSEMAGDGICRQCAASAACDRDDIGDDDLDDDSDDSEQCNECGEYWDAPNMVEPGLCWQCHQSMFGGESTDVDGIPHCLGCGDAILDGYAHNRSGYCATCGDPESEIPF